MNKKPISSLILKTHVNPSHIVHHELPTNIKKLSVNITIMAIRADTTDKETIYP
jgi:hypothetical protein